MPRIVYLTEGFYPPIVGGVEKHAHDLARRLASKGQELFVITRRLEPRSAPSERIGNVFVRRITPRGELKGKRWKAFLPIVLFLVKLFYFLIKYRKSYDIVLVSGTKILPIPSILMKMISKKQCVIKVESPSELWEDIFSHSLQKINRARHSILPKLFRIIRNGLLKRSDCIISISSEITAVLIDNGIDPHKIRSIPNGIVSVEKFHGVSDIEKENKRCDLSLPVNKIIFTFTGRLAFSKGVPLLLEVWKDLVQRYNDIHLIFIGSGKNSFDSCEGHLCRCIDLYRLEDSVSIIGEVDNVHEYLQASDVFVFPSEYEGLPLAVMEAMACELPTIATNVGAVSELIENHKNGILVSPKDAPQLQHAIEWLLAHRGTWGTLGFNARKVICERYSIDIVAEKYRQLFSELAGGELRPSCSL